MKISNEQIEMLVGMVVSAEQDESDCESCFEKLAELGFAGSTISNENQLDITNA